MEIIGAGPAGAAAAITACQLGRPVRLFEKSLFPRHKVCGEFLSPEVGPVLDKLGLWERFQQAAPARLARVHLHFGTRPKGWTLAEPAFGLSRRALDHLLLSHALASGAALVRGHWSGAALPNPAAPPRVLAYGRKATAPKGSRLFGFKAHFRGPVDDALDLFFFSGWYVGVSAVENQATNVCGLAPERLLRAKGFEIDSLLDASEPLAERLAPLARTMDWLIAGPLVFGRTFRSTEAAYLAGDAFGFIDPFTGSGVAGALITGRMAGSAAALEVRVREHVRKSWRALVAQYRTAALLRFALQTGLAEKLAAFVPGGLLFDLTRPRVLF